MAQQCLRDEWVEQYGKSGGKVAAPKPSNPKAPGSAIQPCPCKKAKLVVRLNYDPLPLPLPIAGVKVTIDGPLRDELTSDASGMVTFVDLPPGSYTVSAVYDLPNPVVDYVSMQVGSIAWAYAAVNGEFAAETNKCSLFVNDMISGAGHAVPLKPHVKGRGFGKTVMLPLNAGDWADASRTIDHATVVFDPQPGDVVAWSHPEYSDATGHVGIVSYPMPAKQQIKVLAPGDFGNVDLTLRRQVIGANETSVEEDDYHFWHYYDAGDAKETGRIVFRRLK